MVKCNRTTSWV